MEVSRRYTFGMQVHVDRRLAAGWVACWVVALVLLATSGSQGIGAQLKAAPTCSTLLTASELTTILGEKTAAMGVRQRGPGESECPWILRGGSSGSASVVVQFYDLSHVEASPKAPTLDAFFETLVTSAEGAASGKREPLPGIGEKAAFIPTTPQVVAVVQRADGVARIAGNNLTKAQITAVARAVATP